jgi:hypothetical protein
VVINLCEHELDESVLPLADEYFIIKMKVPDIDQRTKMIVILALRHVLDQMLDDPAWSLLNTVCIIFPAVSTNAVRFAFFLAHAMFAMGVEPKMWEELWGRPGLYFDYADIMMEGVDCIIQHTMAQSVLPVPAKVQGEWVRKSLADLDKSKGEHKDG